MKTSLGFLALILGLGLLTVGCESDSGGSSVQVSAEEFSTTTPPGLAADKFTIAGRGTTYIFSCTAISGAVSYTFTSSTLGWSETVTSPEASVLNNTSHAAVSFTVYATNGDGVNTRTATTSISF